MHNRLTPMKRCALFAAALALISTGFAKMEKWAPTQGEPFKAEPAEVVGPFALFKMPDKSGRLLPLNLLAPADCVRFATALQKVATPAADWAESQTDIGYEIYGHAMKVDGDKLVSVDLKGRPEPRFYALFYAGNGIGESWGLLGRSNWQFSELKRNYPGLVEGYMFGIKHSFQDHTKMAAQMKVPYLVSDLDSQGSMDYIRRIVPAWGYGLVIANSNGVPLDLTKGEDDEQIRAFFAKFRGILDLLPLDNPQGVAPRLHYWKAVQPALHAADKADPMLVGDPLNGAKLRELGVGTFAATVYISAEGKVTGVSIASGAQIPEDLVVPITTALHNGIFVPAVDHGKFVAGNFHYKFGD